MTGSDGIEDQVFALISGGGTGGHVYPALALAEALVARGHDPRSVRFVGARRGLEARVVPAAGFAIDLLPGRGIERRLSFRNLGAIWEDLVALVRAVGVVRRLRPRVVVGVGGFASVPCVVAAWLLRVPIVVHEQNAAPGLANRLAVRLGARAAVGFPGTPLRDAVCTGEPVRPQVAAVRRAPEHDLVLVTGGSLGAQRINDAALELYARWRDRADVAVHHVCGARNLAGCEARLEVQRRPGDRLEYTLVGYADDIASLYERASVAVSRAGAITVAELTAVGLPAIVVPLPGAPGDHQTANAHVFADAGAGVVLPDADCDGETLAGLLENVLADPDRLEAMSAAARSLARPDAAEHLAALVEEHARAA